MASPSAACRPWPTCSGPVGFAETNSTTTRRPSPRALRPYAAPAATTCASPPVAATLRVALGVALGVALRLPAAGSARALARLRGRRLLVLLPVLPVVRDV